jgi:hypothetical protein
MEFVSTSVRNLYFATNRLLGRICAEPDESDLQFGVNFFTTIYNVIKLSISLSRCALRQPG